MGKAQALEKSSEEETYRASVVRTRAQLTVCREDFTVSWGLGLGGGVGSLWAQEMGCRAGRGREKRIPCAGRTERASKHIKYRHV